MAYDEALRSITCDAGANVVAKTGYPSIANLSVTNKALTSNVVTLTTSQVHGLVTGQQVVVVITTGDVDKATLDGTYTVASVPSETTFTYSKTASNIGSAAATGVVTATVPAPAGFQYRFVKVTAARTVSLCDTTTNEIPLGVLYNKPQILGAACTVVIGGVALVTAGGTVTAGEPVKVDTVGRVVNATRGTDAALYVGVAQSSATAAGQLVSVSLKIA